MTSARFSGLLSLVMTLNWFGGAGVVNTRRCACSGSGCPP